MLARAGSTAVKVSTMATGRRIALANFTIITTSFATVSKHYRRLASERRAVNVDRASDRRQAHLERLSRIEASGHPGFLEAGNGAKCCDKHGSYAATAGVCPVCDGLYHGFISPRRQPARDYDDDIDPVTLEPVDWFERRN